MGHLLLGTNPLGARRSDRWRSHGARDRDTRATRRRGARRRRSRTSADPPAPYRTTVRATASGVPTARPIATVLRPWASTVPSTPSTLAPIAILIPISRVPLESGTVRLPFSAARRRPCYVSAPALTTALP